MIDIFAIVFALNVVAIILMIREYKKLNEKNNGAYNRMARYNVSELHGHKNAIQLLIFLGSAGGILLWGILIGLAVSVITGDFFNLIQGFRISTTISFLPSAFGVLKVYASNQSK